MLMPAAEMQLMARANAPGRSSDKVTARSAAMCGCFIEAPHRKPRCYHASIRGLRLGNEGYRLTGPSSELAVVHLGVRPLRIKQFVMRAPLHNPAVLHHQDD